MYIVELGGGHGRFAFLLLKKLLRLREFFPQVDVCCFGHTLTLDRCCLCAACVLPVQSQRAWPFKYVLTDFSEANIQFWREHHCFKPFIQAGLLDFALFDAESDHELTLVVGGQKLSAATVKNPVAIIGERSSFVLPFRISHSHWV